MLLRLDVVVDLELGLVGLLCRSVLQLPGGDREEVRCRGGGWMSGMKLRQGEQISREKKRNKKQQEKDVLGFNQNALTCSKITPLI